MQDISQSNGIGRPYTEDVPEKTAPVIDTETPIHSEAVEDILSHRPSFLTRWGLFIVVFILGCIFGATWFIQYPDIVQANATLTAANAPKELVIRQDGKLLRLFVNNGDTVVKGKDLAWIEATADHPEVSGLSDLLDKAAGCLRLDQTEKVALLFRKPFRNLGELQGGYQQFITAWQQFDDYLVNGFYYKRKLSLDADLDYLKKMHNSLEQQRDLASQDLQLTQEAANANDTLLSENVISKQDMRDMSSKLVLKKMSIPQLSFSVLQNENFQVDKQKEVDQLEHDIAQQKIIFQQALQTMKSAVDEWMLKYVIRAPVDGRVAFIVPLQENQFLSAGKTVGFVNPGDSRFYALVNLPQDNFGKMNTGEWAQLRFDAYPYREFGYVDGRLKYISEIPSDSGFLASIELPSGLVTNYNKRLQYRSGLKLQALIVTKDSRLFERFIASLRGLSQR